MYRIVIIVSYAGTVIGEEIADILTALTLSLAPEMPCTPCAAGCPLGVCPGPSMVCGAQWD